MIDLSRNELGSTFQKLEKSLGLLVSYMNHDASMHRYGVAVGTETSGGNRLFERELNISDTS